ncbi:MAG TPA: patatin family protein [Candidatus Blautia intestinavium]|nr:patatin family protein [Candidatus Blautia intestinavium]
MNTGLVLEGGAMRGIYTAGVLDVFMEYRLHFDGVIGVSAGALHGCSFVSGQKGRSIRYYKKYRNDWRFMSFKSLLRTGDIVGEKFCYHDIPERLDPFDYEAYAKSDTDFYAVCTNLETGKAEYIKITDMQNQIDVMRASASMPYVSKIVSWNGMKLLDGGCADSIPVKQFRKMGYEKNVVVLTREDGYEKKPQNARMAEARYHRYPAFAETLKNRHLVYNRTLKDIREMEAKEEIFVIRPSEKLTISRMEKNLDEIQKVYDIGRKDAENCMAKLCRWLEKSVV